MSSDGFGSDAVSSGHSKMNGLLRPDLLQTHEVKAYEGARHTVNDLVFAAYLES